MYTSFAFVRLIPYFHAFAVLALCRITVVVLNESTNDFACVVFAEYQDALDFCAGRFFDSAGKPVKAVRA